MRTSSDLTTGNAGCYFLCEIHHTGNTVVWSILDLIRTLNLPAASFTTYLFEPTPSLLELSLAAPSCVIKGRVAQSLETT